MNNKYLQSLGIQDFYIFNNIGLTQLKYNLLFLLTVNF